MKERRRPKMEDRISLGPRSPFHSAQTGAQLLLFSVLRVTGDALRVIRPRAGRYDFRPFRKARARAGRLGRRGGFGRAVTGDAGFAHSHSHGGAFKPGLMTVGAIGAPLLASRDVNQMKLLFQTVLRGGAERVQFPSLPIRLRNAPPLPAPVDYGITGHAAVRGFEQLPRNRRLKFAAVLVAAGAGHVRDQQWSEVGNVVHAVHEYAS